jgi:UDP-N-acetylmuramate dehydrogenase
MRSISILQDNNPDLDIRFSENMSDHTSWAVGGPAEIFFMPKNVEELKKVFSVIKGSLPVTWIGLGSNLLVRDKGVRGMVICTQKMNKKVEVEDEFIKVSCSVPCATLAKLGVEKEYGPTLFFSGIPGTVGGALAMNAGSHGFETWDYVSHVHTLDLNGNEHRRKKSEIDISYRRATPPNSECYISAAFKFKKINQSKEDLKNILKLRKESQPIGERSCGSVFMNPEDDYAGRLIEAVGYKGYIYGGARISEKHANFIINDGDATAKDIETLINILIEAIHQKFGIKMQTEVRIIGN